MSNRFIPEPGTISSANQILCHTGRVQHFTRSVFVVVRRTVTVVDGGVTTEEERSCEAADQRDPLKTHTGR